MFFWAMSREWVCAAVISRPLTASSGRPACARAWLVRSTTDCSRADIVPEDGVEIDADVGGVDGPATVASATRLTVTAIRERNRGLITPIGSPAVPTIWMLRTPAEGYCATP